MGPILARRPRARTRRGLEEFAPTSRPLLRPAPRSAMFFPLVVLVAVLPGLYALRNWDLNPPGPWWGLRGLAVLEGRVLDQVPAASGLGAAAEARTYAAVALQPPLYAWLEAAALWVSFDNAPLATILPSYAAGVLVVMLVYWQGRLWRGPGLGLTAAILTGFNRDLLVQMQQATPTTLGLAGLLAALLGYGHHLRAGDGRRPGWAPLGGLALGLSLLTIGGYGLLALPVVLLHQAAIAPEPVSGRRPVRWWELWRSNPSLWAGALALAIGLALAGPWYALMARRYGGGFLAALLAPPQVVGPGYRGPLLRLLELAPATAPLGLFAAARAVRRALVAEGDDPATVGTTLWVVWLGVAALAPAALPHGSRPAMNLFLLVPLNLLAAQAMTDLAGRRIPARSLAWLAPLTACSVAWWFSSDLRGAVDQLASGDFRLSSNTALGLHLGLDLVVALGLATRHLDRWARRRDDRRRRVLGGFLGAVAAVTVASGLREVGFRHRETSDLLSLRQAILRHHRERPFTLLAVVGPELGGTPADGPQPGGRLRFLLRATLPELAQLDLARTDDLLGLPPGRRLVILAGTSEHLSYPLQQKLNLEAIHPGRDGVLDAFATAIDDGRPPRR